MEEIFKTVGFESAAKRAVKFQYGPQVRYTTPVPINSDPTTHTIVMCANVLVRMNGKYLVHRRSPHKKVLPNIIHTMGGKVDPGENPYEAAIREVKEESGLTVKNVKLEAFIQELEPHQKGEDWLIFHFSADYESGELTPNEEGEFVFLTKEELLREELFVSLKAVIEDIVDPEKGAVFMTMPHDNSAQTQALRKYLTS